MFPFYFYYVAIKLHSWGTIGLIINHNKHMPTEQKVSIIKIILGAIAIIAFLIWLDSATHQEIPVRNDSISDYDYTITEVSNGEVIDVYKGNYYIDSMN